MIEIRAAKEQDMEAVLSIYNYEVMHGTATFDVVPRTMEEQMDWFRRHDGGRHPVLVAVEDGRVVGFASLRLTATGRPTMPRRSFPCMWTQRTDGAALPGRFCRHCLPEPGSAGISAR